MPITNTESFIDELKVALSSPLPGRAAHQSMDPLKPGVRQWNHDRPPRQSAVLILMHASSGELSFPLIQRPEYEGHHSGQIALPGGKMEESDLDLVETALRETREEIGVDSETIRIVGQLTKIYVPPSNYEILPVIGWTSSIQKYVPDEREVASVFDVTIAEFLDPVNQGQRGIKLKRGLTMDVPVFDFNGKVVWGATAMILSEMLAVLKRTKI